MYFVPHMSLQQYIYLNKRTSAVCSVGMSKQRSCNQFHQVKQPTFMHSGAFTFNGLDYPSIVDKTSVLLPNFFSPYYLRLPLTAKCRGFSENAHLTKFVVIRSFSWPVLLSFIYVSDLLLFAHLNRFNYNGN